MIFWIIAISLRLSSCRQLFSFSISALWFQADCWISSTSFSVLCLSCYIVCNWTLNFIILLSSSWKCFQFVLLFVYVRLYSSIIIFSPSVIIVEERWDVPLCSCNLLIDFYWWRNLEGLKFYLDLLASRRAFHLLAPLSWTLLYVDICLLS